MLPARSTVADNAPSTDASRLRFPDTVFATALIDPAVRTTAFRRWLRPFAMLDPAGKEPVDASVVAYRLGQISLSQSFSSMAHYVRDRSTIDKSRFKECVLLRLLLNGKVRGTFGDHAVDIREDDIYLTDMSMSSELWLQGPCKHINVMMPRASMSGFPIHGRVLPGEWLASRMLREHLVHFLDVLQYSDAEDIRQMVKATVDLLHFCLRTDNIHLREHGHFDETRERIVEYIDRHLREPELDAPLLQKEFGMARASLYKLFAEFGGIQHYIRNKRLQAVLHDLCNEPNTSINEIIARHGFTSERQFQRAFRARFGMTATEARAGWRSHVVTGPYGVVS